MRTRREGFTLIEVLIAMVILSVGLMGVVPMLIHVTRGNSFGKTTTEAATFSQDKLEQLRRGAFGDLTAMCTAGANSDAVGGFTREWRVVDAAGTAGCAGIDVYVIEVCTEAGYDCFPGLASPNPAPDSHYFLTVRANFDF